MMRVECQFSSKRGVYHVAEESHEGRFGEGTIYVAVCDCSGVDLFDYYTSEVVEEVKR